MEDKLRAHMDVLFEDAPVTQQAMELKEEMLMNLEEKYRDLLAEGKSEEAAFNIAVAGIGDISGLIGELEDPVGPGGPHGLPKGATALGPVCGRGGLPVYSVPGAHVPVPDVLGL